MMRVFEVNYNSLCSFMIRGTRDSPYELNDVRSGHR